MVKIAVTWHRKVQRPSLGSWCCRFAEPPFYCPRDQKVYLDTSFFRDMQRRFGGGGDFAYAYVIAHEYGHHIENLMGVLPREQQAQQRAQSRVEANRLSVRVELMADCLAGVWAAHANRRWRILEPGDVEEGIEAWEAAIEISIAVRGAPWAAAGIRAMMF